MSTLDELLEHISQEFRRREKADVLCYTEEEAAQLLGVSRDTLRREREDGRITAIRVRSQVRYPHAQLVRYLKTRERA